MIAKLLELKEIAKDTVTLTFAPRDNNFTFIPGQYCKVTLINPSHTDRRGNSRFLGFVSSPSEKSSFSFTTRLGISSFKKSLTTLPVGGEVEIGEIEGRINNLPEDQNQHIVFVAGGIGIAPIMSILRYSQEKSWPYYMTLVFANRLTATAAYLAELESMPQASNKFNLITTITDDPDWKGEKRKINLEFIREYFDQPEKSIFIVTGTPKFVPTVYREIKSAGVPVSNLKMEIFTGY